jgi:hypothetical protein
MWPVGRTRGIVERCPMILGSALLTDSASDTTPLPAISKEWSRHYDIKAHAG